MRLPDYLTRYSAPSSSSSTSESYDYSGFDDHIKRQDAIGALRDGKFAALYGGDVAGAVSSGNKIRDLLKTVRANTPNATERDPVQLTTPLVRVSSRSSSSNAGGADFSGDMHRFQPLHMPDVPEVPKVQNVEKVLGNAGELNPQRQAIDKIKEDRRRAGIEGKAQYLVG